jgi:hypothetical protein
VSNYCGNSSDTLTIGQLSAPAVALGKDTLMEKVDRLLLEAGNPGSAYLWSTGDTSQTIVVNSFGKYWVRVSNPCGTASDTILIAKIGGRRVLNDSDISIYPNPSDGKINIEFGRSGKFEVSVYDLSGQLVHQETLSGSRTIIQLEQQPKGSYLVKIKDDFGREGSRVVLLQ